MSLHRCLGAGLALWLLSAAGVEAGGSGLNVVVVVNQSSTNSVQLGNYYCERRGVPPQNLLRINWSGGNATWTRSDFETSLLNPLVAMLASRGLTNQADYVVLSMDIPFQVTDTNGFNATTAALFYGFMTNDCPVCMYPGCTLPDYTSNAYAFSEGIFRQTPPSAAGTQSWLVTMITADSLGQAQALVDRGVASDGAFPGQTVSLAKTADILRNIRYWLFDDAIFNARLRGNYSMLRTNQNTPYGQINLLGYQTGLAYFSASANAFVPGAMADSLTSTAGLLFGGTDQTNLLAFIEAGACGSYGTVVEPCAYLQKFPSPQNYFYQARGFSLAECYYQSVLNPYQGLIVAEPLAAPFARPPLGAWTNLPANAELSGVTNLTLHCVAATPDRPVQQVDLFLDGTWLQTLANIPPAAGNQLNVTCNGYATNYPVPTNATIKTVAAGLADVLNQSGYAGQTGVQAAAAGDRITLQFTNLSPAGANITVSAGSAIGSAAALTSGVAVARTNFLDSIAFGLRNYSVTNAPGTDAVLQVTVTKTNGTPVTVAVTNSPGNTNAGTLVLQLVNAINSDASLSAADGVAAEDFIDYLPVTAPPLNGAEFNLRARTAGWPAAQIQVALTGSAGLAVTPGGAHGLDQNLGDLQPRNHLYLLAGVTNLWLTFPLDTTALADGSHELTAVIYEGSHVRTQARVPQAVRIRNTPLSATFATLAGASNTVLNFTLLFSVVANTNTIARIELFSTGGSVGVVSNQSSATFAVAATNLGVGLHPLYAVVTRTDGREYRTETKWIRLGGAEPPFGLTLTAPPPVLAWPATAGQLYEILSSTNVTGVFQSRGTVVPSNSPGSWTETILGAPRQFYRVRAP
ncbi:MAG TPA: TIGR03790 family protein [Candidatus Acidoferrum sp.]|nr:TIGR03790 family protein [Candidatus Acidoferrum sp.]